MNQQPSAIRRLSLVEVKLLWNRLLTTEDILPMLSYAWYEIWTNINAEFEPYLLLINDRTIAPFVRSGDTVSFAQKYTDLNDLVGVKEDWEQILQYLKTDGVKKIEFENIPSTSPTVKFFKSFAEKNPSRCTVIAAKTAPYISLPKTFEEYLTSIREKRKKYNRFLREYPELEIITSSDPEQDVETLITLMEKNPIKRASFTPAKKDFFRAVAKLPKSVRLLLLKIHGEVIAAQIMFIHNGATMVYISGYDNETYANAGTFLLMCAIKQSIESGDHQFSFLIGKESYKYELGAKDFELYSVTAHL